MNQLSLFFDGRTFSPARDGERLGKQLGAVKEVMRDHDWHTLAELSHKAGGSTASVSARLRDLRKARFGGYQVERRYVSEGLWEYRIP